MHCYDRATYQGASLQVIPQRASERTGTSTPLLVRAIRGLLLLVVVSQNGLAANPSEQELNAGIPGLTITTALRPRSFLEATCPHQAAWGTPQTGVQLWRWPLKLVQITDITVVIRNRTIDLTNATGTVVTTPAAQRILLRVGSEETRSIYLYSSEAPCATVVELRGSWGKDDGVLLTLHPVLLPMHRGTVAAENEVHLSKAGLEVRSRRFDIGFRVLAPRSRISFSRRNGAILARLSGPAPTRLVFVADTGQEAAPEAREFHGLSPYRVPPQLASVLNSLPEVRFDDTGFFRPLAWSAISLHRLWVVNPDLGPGLISGYGPADRDPLRPRYAWFFDEPMLANVAYTRLGMADPIRDALRLLTRYQGPGGKPVHEITQSLRYWPEFFREFPYAYMHADSGPFFIVGHWLFWRGSGDTRLIREHWTAIRRAYRWCTQQIDEETGLFVIGKGDWGGTEASIEIDRDVFTNGMWLVALRALTDMAEFLGDKSTESDARERLARYAPLMEDAFWDEQEQRFFWGYKRDGERVPRCFPQAAVPFWLGAFSHERVRKTVAYWFDEGYATPWGIRTIPPGDDQYDPDSYQLGSVWPVWTSAVQLAALRIHSHRDLYQQWRQGMAAMFLSETNGHMPELLRGDRFELATGAVQHQMFSHLLPVNTLIDGFLGVSVHAPRRILSLSPNLPPEVRVARGRGLYFGEHERFDICYEKTQQGWTIALDLRRIDGGVLVRAALPTRGGHRIDVRVDGASVHVQRSAGRARLEVRLSPGRHRIQLTERPSGSKPGSHAPEREE